MTASLLRVHQLECHKFTIQSLLKKGSAQKGSGSWVFLVQLALGGDAILKLNISPNEVSQTAATNFGICKVSCFAFICQCLGGCATLRFSSSHVFERHGIVLVRKLVCCFCGASHTLAAGF